MSEEIEDTKTVETTEETKVRFSGSEERKALREISTSSSAC